MNAAARAVVDAAQRLGFVVDGYDGKGHIRLVHPNGSHYNVAATPSDHRNNRNAVAALERLAGTKLPRANHRRSHKRIERTGFALDVAAREQQRWHAANDDAVTAMCERRDVLIERARALAATGRRASLLAIPPLLRRIADIETRLIDDFRQDIDRFDPYTLGGTTT